jgi:hypothetical protein
MDWLVLVYGVIGRRFVRVSSLEQHQLRANGLPWRILKSSTYRKLMAPLLGAALVWLGIAIGLFWGTRG